MDVEQACASGTLLHPLEGAPNSVDLFRALVHLAGGAVSEAGERERSLIEQVGHHDHYLLVLVDGLGLSLRDQFPAGGFLEQATRSSLHAVFPSTTAVALTSLATASWPARHGVTGWFTCFPEHRRVLAPLLFSERGTRVPASELGLRMEDLIPLESVIGSFFRTTRSFYPAAISEGAYSRWSRGGTQITPYRTLRHAFRLLRDHYRSIVGPTYSYLYIITVDKLSHHHGAQSRPVAEEVARVDRLLGRLRDALPQSVRMVVTADHGLVDVPQEARYSFSHRDAIASHLIAGQTGEATTPIFHVREGHADAFLEAFARHPSSTAFTLHTPDELARLGFYGPEPLSPASRAHLGDYVGIAAEPAMLEYLPPRADGSPEAPVSHVGVHGGLRPAEMRVPLAIV